MKKIWSIGVGALGAVLVAAFAAAIVVPAEAADFIKPTGKEGNVTINRSETHHNLYVAGGNVSINSATSGDLYGAGGNVSVDGVVEGDVVLAGGVITISEPVNGDVRIGGGNVTINAPVKGDVLVGSGTLILTDKASVGGELRVGGGNVTISAPVNGGLYVMGGNITINSKITGNVKITAKEQLTFGPQADVAAPVDYVGKQAALVSDSANVPTVNFTNMKNSPAHRGQRTGLAGFVLGSFLIKLVAMIIAGLVAVGLFPRQLAMVNERIYMRPLGSLGVGFVTLILVPIASVLAIIVVLGYYLAIVALLAYALALIIACLVGTLFVGAWVIKLATRKPALELNWQAVIVGVLIVSIVGLIPVVGWAACAVIYLMTFGAMVNMFREYGRRSTARVQPVE